MRTLSERLRARRRLLGLVSLLSQGTTTVAFAVAGLVLLGPTEVVVQEVSGRARVVSERPEAPDEEDASALMVQFVRLRAVPFYGEVETSLASAEALLGEAVRELDRRDRARREALERYRAEAQSRELRARLDAHQTRCRREVSETRVWACELKGRVVALAGDQPEAWVVVMRAFAQEVRRTRRTPAGLRIIYYELRKEAAA